MSISQVGRPTSAPKVRASYARGIRGHGSGSKQVLVLVRNRRRGRTSGLQLEERSVANLFKLRRGKVTRIVVYLDREQALADLGIAPDTGSWARSSAAKHLPPESGVSQRPSRPDIA